MYDIEWKPRALKQLRRVPAGQGKAIRDAVDTLAEPKSARGVKRLKNHRYGFRLRVGNYRVLFDIVEVVRVVSIEEVKRRDEQTY